MALPLRREEFKAARVGRGGPPVEVSAQNQNQRKDGGRERWREGRGGDMKGKANPQKPFDISHQSAMLTFLTLHFQLSAKSSA